MVDQLDHSVNLGFSLVTFRLQVIESTRRHLQSFRFLPVPTSIWNNPGFFPSRNSMCSIGLWQSKNLQEFFSICYSISLPMVDKIHAPQASAGSDRPIRSAQRTRTRQQLCKHVAQSRNLAKEGDGLFSVSTSSVPQLGFTTRQHQAESSRLSPMSPALAEITGNSHQSTRASFRQKTAFTLSI